MSLARRTTQPGISSWRARLLTGALVTCLILSGVLAWQTIASSLSHRQLAQEVMRDYSRLAGEQFFRAVFQQLGYQGIYQSLTALAQLPAGWAQDPARNPTSLPATDLASHFFEQRSGQLEITTADPQLEQPSAELLQEIHAALSAIPDADPFRVSTSSIDGQVRLIAVARRDQDRVGMVLAPDAVQAIFEDIVANTPLLPASLNPQRLLSSAVYLELRTPQGNRVFQAGPEPDQYFTVSMTPQRDYSGLFWEHPLTVGVQEQAAQSLIIGGLPRSRLPLLMALLVVNLLLIALGIGLLFREREVMRLRSDFVSRVSHELRTPLTQIRMFAETLSQDRLAQAADRQRALAIIEKESVRLSHLVDNVLQFSRSERGVATLAPRELELGSLLREVCRQYQPLANERDVALDVQVQDGLIGRVDAEALQQILINLLDNAVKFGPAGQTVSVRLRRQGEQAAIAVQDQGPGIERSEEARIWQQFWRSPNSNAGGTGIGLTIVADLVHRMGGAIDLQSDTTGTCITVCLPLVSP